MVKTVEDFARTRATRSREDFLASVGGAAVLIRLDERGGKGDPTPWAFHVTSTPFSSPPREDDQVTAAGLQVASAADDDRSGFDRPDEEVTVTVAAAALILPPARGAASVVPLPIVFGSDAVVRLGRSSECDVMIGERSISRQHASFRAGEHGLRVRDVGSSQGTRVNGMRLNARSDRPLVSGDVLEFGDVRCLYLHADRFWEHVEMMMD